MIVSKYISSELVSADFPDAPNPNGCALKTYKADDIKLVFLKNPSSLGLSPTVVIPYALVALNSDGEYIFAAALEQTDLRELSSLTSIPLRQLQEEEGVRGFLTNAKLVLYGDDKKEDLGSYSILLSEIDAIADDLMEYALDSLDILTEAEEI